MDGILDSAEMEDAANGRKGIWDEISLTKDHILIHQLGLWFKMAT